LYELIQRVIDGNSEHYQQEMTMLQFAKNYAESPQWSKTLCKILKISDRETFEDFFGLAPRVHVRGDDGLILRALGGTSMSALQEMPILLSSVY
jgi:hypothetical protein